MTGPHALRTLARLGAALGLLVAVLVSASPASAHAELETSNPADGSTVDTVPDQIQLVFTEVVGQPASVSVTGPGGEDVGAGEASVVDDTLTQPLAEDASAEGTYTVSYRLTSSDGHVISGTVKFSVGQPGGSGDGTDHGAHHGTDHGAHHGTDHGTGHGADPAADEEPLNTGLVGGLVGGLALVLALAGYSLSRLVGRDG